MSVIEHIISYIAPHTCLACSAEGDLLCKQCIRTLPVATQRCFQCLKPTPAGLTCDTCRRIVSLNSVRSAVSYGDVAKGITHRLKFERAKAAVKPMASCMNLDSFDSDYLVTFAPAATNRVRMRGYDQSRLLAKEIGHTYSLPVASLLARSRNTRQVGSSGEERRSQQQQAFRIVNGYLASNTKILIVDDVITTGSTLNACAQLLIAAGAKQVDALTFAQA